MEELALASHERAIAAWDNGWFDDEVTPYGDVARDKRPRRDTTREKMAALKTLTPDGLLTAAKASQISDGVSAVVLASAKPPPRQMPLFGPVHGPPLPRVDHESSLQAKVGLYRTLFAGRSDVYAYRWENTAEGTKGWAPKRRPGTTRDNPEYLPLTDEVISAHLTKGKPGRLRALRDAA